MAADEGGAVRGGARLLQDPDAFRRATRRAGSGLMAVAAPVNFLLALNFFFHGNTTLALFALSAGIGGLLLGGSMRSSGFANYWLRKYEEAQRLRAEKLRQGR